MQPHSTLVTIDCIGGIGATLQKIWSHVKGKKKKSNKLFLTRRFVDDSAEGHLENGLDCSVKS